MNNGNTVRFSNTEVYAEAIRRLRVDDPDRYNEWFATVDPWADDRTVLRDALIAVADRDDMTVIETGDQMEYLLHKQLWGQA